MRKTSAWLFASAYLLLIVYSSLHPFVGWRYQGEVSWGFLWAGPPQYWTAFDLLSNVVGYMPMGFVLAVARMRSGSGGSPVRVAVLWSAVLSLAMEALQVFLPARVPSNLDVLLNVAGAGAGAAAAARLHRAGWLERWAQYQQAWFGPESRLELVLLALWPCALLFPTAIPLGLGQVGERLARLASVEGGMLDASYPVYESVTPLGEALAVGLGGALPLLLAYTVVPAARRRLVLAAWLGLGALGATSLSMGISLGMDQALRWLDHAPVQAGLLLMAGLGWGCRGLGQRALVVLTAGLALAYLWHVNTTGTASYFEQTLASWQHGRFSRFHGLLQWLGWAWPYGLLVTLVRRGWLAWRTRIQA